jgi:hypothetical protein
VLLFFSVARFAPNGQAERATTGHHQDEHAPDSEHCAHTLDKLLDITPEALRMSSPFNAGYWLSAV